MDIITPMTSDAIEELFGIPNGFGNNETPSVESFGYFLEDYIISGAEATSATQNHRKVTVSVGIISFNGVLWQVPQKSFQVSGSMTYYIDFTAASGYVIGKTHPAGDYLPLWQANAIGSGDIVQLLDMRGDTGGVRFKAEVLGMITDQLIVDEFHILPGSINHAHLQPGIVQEGNIADNQVSFAKIKGPISEGKLKLDYASAMLAQRLKYLEQNPGGILEVLAARGGYASLSERLDAMFGVSVMPDSYAWTSTAGQSVFTLPAGKQFPADIKRTFIYLGGGRQFAESGNFTISTDRMSITVAEALPAGIQVNGYWFTGAIPLVSGHGSAHKAGGSDALNLRELVGANSLPYNVDMYGISGTGFSSIVDPLNTAINAISAAGGGVLVFTPGTYRISKNVTVPVNVQFQFIPGALLSIDAGAKMTINSFISHRHQWIFTGAGDVYVNATDEYFPAWFGLNESSLDNAPYVNKCLVSMTDPFSGKSLNGGKVIFPKGWFKFNSSVNFTVKNYSFVGAGESATRLQFTSAKGVFFKRGLYDGVPDYVTVGASVEYTRFAYLTIEGWGAGGYVATNTDAASLAPRNYGIVDYEGGTLHLDHCVIQNFYTGIWGIASDVDECNRPIIKGCEYGIDFYTRCDQQILSGVYFYGNYTGIRTHGSTQVTFGTCLFVDNVGLDVDLQSGEGTAISPDGVYSMGSVKNSQGITFDTCWWENLQDKYNGGAYPRQALLGAKEAFVRIGYGNTTSDKPICNVRFTNNFLEANQTVTVANAFIKMKYAVGVVVDGLTSWYLNKFPVILTEGTGTVVAPSDGSVYHMGTYTLNNIRTQNRTGTDTFPLVQGTPSPIQNVSEASNRRSIIGNPTMYGNAYGWQLTSGAITVAPYTLAAGEVSVGGSPITLTTTATSTSMKWTVTELRSYSCYEIVMRYKLVLAEAPVNWTIKLANADGTVPNNYCYRYLTDNTDFSEIRFIVPTYAANTFTGPVQISLVYGGANATKSIIVDYIDVFEVTPYESPAQRGGIGKVIYGSAVPTSGTWMTRDTIKNSNKTELGSAGSKYVIEEWECTAGGTPGTWISKRYLTGN